jgi:lysophospholipase L1-like esterase
MNATMAPFADGDRVAFYGDSITQLGGCILRVFAKYREAFPGRDVRFFNVGISGGGLDAAELYFDGWLAPLRPTRVVLAFGVNGAGVLHPWAEAPDPAAEERRVREAAASFRARYAALVARVEALGAKAIVRTTTPYDAAGEEEGAVPPDLAAADAYRRASDEIRAVAAERGLPLVDDHVRMSALLAAGERLFSPDRVHPTDLGQWRMAETLLAAQGLPIEPWRPRREAAAAAGLADWDAAAGRLSELLSAEWLVVRDETLDLPARLAKARAWLAKSEGDPNANPYIVKLARAYLVDKPREAELRAAAGFP